METTLVVHIKPRKALPVNQAERIAWFEMFDLLPEKAEVQVTADMRDWAAAGFTIQEDGTPYDIVTELGHGPLVDAIIDLIHQTGRVPGRLDGAEVKTILGRMAKARAV
jgi:hypothetical protein